MYQNYSIKVTKKLGAISKTVLQKQILYAVTKWWCTEWQNVIPEEKIILILHSNTNSNHCYNYNCKQGSTKERNKVENDIRITLCIKPDCKVPRLMDIKRLSINTIYFMLIGHKPHKLPECQYCDWHKSK